MEAQVGDRVHVHGHMAGPLDVWGEIIEVRGPHGQPPYLVAFNDGHRGLIFPGPAALIEHTAQNRTAPSPSTRPAPGRPALARR